MSRPPNWSHMGGSRHGFPNSLPGSQLGTHGSPWDKARQPAALDWPPASALLLLGMDLGEKRAFPPLILSQNKGMDGSLNERRSLEKTLT